MNKAEMKNKVLKFLQWNDKNGNYLENECTLDEALVMLFVELNRGLFEGDATSYTFEEVQRVLNSNMEYLSTFEKYLAILSAETEKDFNKIVEYM